MTELQRGATETKDLIVLHVGMHKTGSISIQNNLGRFSDGRVKFAQLGSANHGAFIQAVFGDRRTIPEAGDHIEKKAGSSEPQFRRPHLTRGLRGPEPVAVISGESISVMPEDTVRRLKRYLDRQAREVRV